MYPSCGSICSPLEKGYKIGNKGVVISLQKGDSSIKFDKIMQTSKGFVIGVELKPVSRSDVCMPVLDKGCKVDINQLHKILNHPSEDASEDVVRMTADHYGWELTGKLQLCADCGMAKAKQQKLNNKNTQQQRY